MDAEPPRPEAEISRRKKHSPGTNRRQVRAHRGALRAGPGRRGVSW